MENLVSLLVHNTSDPPTSSPFNERVLGPPYTRTVRITLLTLMILAAILGNVLVLLCTCGRRMRRTQILFLHLAVADLLVAVLAMTSQLVWECMGREWVAGPAFCKGFKVLQTYAMVVSNYLIVAVALDRFWAIVYPLMTRPGIKKVIWTAWLLSLVPSLPNAYIFHQYTTRTGKTFCVAKYYTHDLSIEHRQGYMAFILSSVFATPMVILVILYASITHVVWTRPKDLSSCDPGPARAKARTLRMTAIVVVSFLLCATPYAVLETISAFGDPGILNEDLVALIGIVSAANSCANPFVYLFLYAKYIPANRAKCDWCLPHRTLKSDSSKVVMSTSV